VKNLKVVLLESNFACDERTMLFRLKATNGNYERNRKDCARGRTGVWRIDEENLHPNQGQTVVLLMDDPNDKDLVLVYAGVLRQHEFADEVKNSGERILHVGKTFGPPVYKTRRSGIEKFVGKKFASAFMFPFRQEAVTKKASPSKSSSRSLTKRGVADVSFDLAAREVTASPEHNKLTNRLLKLLPNTQQGSRTNAMFDALIKDYNANGNDLLVEVKSSAEILHIRMAIGQLYSYWHAAFGETQPHLAILLPKRPDTEAVDLLRWLNIGLLWMDKGKLSTSDTELQKIANYVA